jgi:murein DD-endopeptidase MepM/ murein hydrolase activator NlpD
VEVSVQLIFVDRRLARARTMNLSRATLAWSIVGLLTLIVAAVLGLYALTFRMAAQRDVPVVKQLVSIVMHDRLVKDEQYLRDNVSAMAKMVGEMQARLMRLDALGERVSKLAGIRPEEFDFRQVPGLGGAEPTASRPLTLTELQGTAHSVRREVDERTDYLNVVESELVTSAARSALLPRNTPVVEGFIGSGFGMRTDPFTGEYTMHTGIDFAAPVGTPIFAAAGGVVGSAEQHPQFGNTVTIDHGNGLSTLYAHASRLIVKVGDIVRKGEQIALVGTTGRSTGPHLHFEVHVNGSAVNPAKYLAHLRPGSPLAGMVPIATAPRVVEPATTAVATEATLSPTSATATSIAVAAPPAPGGAAVATP